MKKIGLQFQWSLAVGTNELIQPSSPASSCRYFWVLSFFPINSLLICRMFCIILLFGCWMNNFFCFMKNGLAHMFLTSFNENILLSARFSHESVGEGEERHLILERCPETSMYVKKLLTITHIFADLKNF